MSWQASAYAKEITVCPNGEAITRAEKFLLLILADYHHHAGVTYPSVLTLARHCLTDERSLRRAIQSLADKGVIDIVHPENQGRAQTTAYRFIEIDGKRKGGVIHPPSAVDKGGAKGGVKEGQRGVKTLPLYKEERELEQEQTTMLIRPWKPNERDCEVVYAEYPRKVGKQKALKSIYRALAEESVKCECDPPNEIVEVIRERTRDFAKSWAGHQEQYTPHPSTWFAAGRYFDDQKEWEQPKR